MKQYLLGIDVGTTGTKTLLFSTDGELLGHAYRGYNMYNPQVGYSKHREMTAHFTKTWESPKPILKMA